ncbi:MAG: S-methyl-5-thioribose-1-phosphate isomerase [Candidatus Riflebacteria bacterium]|nr:S-methyl-5-thioribose-1-phosphate isomerase [Candidatus Riflebacteria bacterium]
MIDTVVYNEISDTVDFIDQTLLPVEKKIVACRDVERMAVAIRRLEVRGAPAIGVAAAFGVYLGLNGFKGSDEALPKHLKEIVRLLGSTRPTAVNLFWALKRVQDVIEKAIKAAPAGEKWSAARDAALAEALTIREEDIEMCRTIGRCGEPFLKNGDTWLTHCNAGALATAGYGTALGVFRAAKEAGKTFHVYVDETRPLLQGARLTAWELFQESISATLICDNMAASLMARGKINGVVVGADRITAHGFVANKIGTYGVAVLAHYHKIPFYVAAPISTFDLHLEHGDDIEIEERDHREITHVGATRLAPEGVDVFNPAFDVTPPELVKAIFTNHGIIKPPFTKNIAKVLGTTKS